MEIVISKEEERHCGFRSTGPDGVGIYLMGEGKHLPCDRLPFPLHSCPVCGGGIKFCRGFTWIVPRQLFPPSAEPCCMNTFTKCSRCAMCSPPEFCHGLLWIGEKYYTPATFVMEAHTRGISKRLSNIPRGFSIGQTKVYLAHRHAIELHNSKQPQPQPGIFMVFTPTHYDIVVNTTDIDKLPPRALRLAKKLGERARLVKVEPVATQEQIWET